MRLKRLSISPVAVFFPGTFYAQQEQARVFFGSLRFVW